MVSQGRPPGASIGRKTSSLKCTKTGEAYDREVRDRVIADRERVASKMSSEEIAEAQKLTREWKATA
jgi:hypothetical protein